MKTNFRYRGHPSPQCILRRFNPFRFEILSYIIILLPLFPEIYLPVEIIGEREHRKRDSRERKRPTHLALYMEGSVPNRECDTVQKGLSLLPQWRLILEVIVHSVLPRVTAAAAIRS